MSFAKDMEKLKTILGTASDLHAATALLDWDMRTYMAPGSIDSRSRQLATLEELAHKTMTSAELGKLVERRTRLIPIPMIAV